MKVDEHKCCFIKKKKKIIQQIRRYLFGINCQLHEVHMRPVVVLIEMPSIIYDAKDFMRSTPTL